MIASQRKEVGRIKAGRCVRHNLALTPSDHFDGGTCALGCKALNVYRQAFLDKTARGWRRN